MSGCPANQEEGIDPKEQRLLRDLIAATDEVTALRTAMRSIIHNEIGRRRWWPHPVLSHLSDATLLAEIERRGLDRWAAILHHERAEHTARAIISEIKAEAAQ